MAELKNLLLAGVFVCASFSSVADSQRSAFERSLVGTEEVSPLSDTPYWLIGHKCIAQGGAVLQGSNGVMYAISQDECDGRVLLRFVKREDAFRSAPKPVFFVLDALLLPPLKPGELLMTAGLCELNGHTDQDFFAIVNLGGKNEVNGQNGVRRAWLPNPQTSLIEELATDNIRCFRQTHP